MSVDWESVRAEFPALGNWTYLNTATFGQLPRRATDAVAGHFAHRDEAACEDFLDWFTDADRIRAAIGRLIDCQARDIAFIPSASAGLSILLRGLAWNPGDQILTVENEFPNNLYAPHFAGVEFVETTWERFYEAVTPRTRLVLLSMLNYSSGFRTPLEEISAFLRERGVLLFVDGTQGLGALRFSARQIRPSVLAVHGYKWMISPTGAGFLYVDPDLRPRLLPAVVGWRSDKRWREVDNLHHGKPEFKDDAERFEGGVLPFPLLYAMEQSVNLMLEIGPERIEGRVLALADSVRAIVRECGAEVADGATPIVSAKFEHHDVSQMARALHARRVLVSARHGHLRISPHFYNTESDLDVLATTLRSIK